MFTDTTQRELGVKQSNKTLQGSLEIGRVYTYKDSLEICRVIDTQQGQPGDRQSDIDPTRTAWR